MRLSPLATPLLALLLVAAPLHARDTGEALSVPPSGVLGVGEAQLTPQFWIDRLAQPDALVMDRAAIAAQNARLLERDPSMHDLRALPATLDRARVAGWIEGLSERPSRPLFDVDGKSVPASTLDALMANRALDAIPATQSTRYGLVVRRAALRTFPTALRVFNEQGDTDIDRFQETAEFPGTPVVIAHASADGQWLLRVSPVNTVDAHRG
ncbi:NlpC-P60 family protein OS=Rhodanobacter lindaniclasticus OX=75310 GN=B1991_08365 PE=3 SV=1 [Rhodanobacter lindaniclasticus]